MPTGHFTIGDLSFSFEGDLKELAHCQEIIREIQRAEQRLRRAAGAQEVRLIYDRDLEGERGTFDKMRLRAYDGSTNYTLDIGVTDNNPLGIYVGYDQNIEAYDREQGKTWEIDPEGNRVETSAEQGPSRGDADAGAQRTEASPRESSPAAASPSGPEAAASSSPSSAQAERTPQAEQGASRAKIERAATALQARVQGHPSDQLVGETTIPDGPLADKLRGFVQYAGRDEGYLSRVLDAMSVPSVERLTVGQVDDAIEMIKDEEVLRQNESFEPDSDLPF
jgi:hypothetical protein